MTAQAPRLSETEASMVRAIARGCLRLRERDATERLVADAYAAFVRHERGDGDGRVAVPAAALLALILSHQEATRRDDEAPGL